MLTTMLLRIWNSSVWRESMVSVRYQTWSVVQQVNVLSNHIDTHQMDAALHEKFRRLTRDDRMLDEEGRITPAPVPPRVQHDLPRLTEGVTVAHQILLRDLCTSTVMGEVYQYRRPDALLKWHPIDCTARSKEVKRGVYVRATVQTDRHVAAVHGALPRRCFPLRRIEDRDLKRRISRENGRFTIQPETQVYNHTLLLLKFGQHSVYPVAL